MKKIATLLLALATPVLAQDQIEPLNLTNLQLYVNGCIVVSISNEGEVEVNYKCAEEYAKQWKDSKGKDVWAGVAVILTAIHNGTAKVKESK